jgi:hypothetical protein
MNFSSVIKEMNSSFSRPYPLLIAEKYCWIYVGIVSVIIAMLISIEQPFGLHAWLHPNKELIIYGFGAVYASVNVILYAILPRLFPGFFCVKSWTVAKELLMLSALFLIWGLANWIHVLSTISYLHVSWSSFGQIQLYTFTFGFFPVFGLTSFVYTKSLVSKSKPGKDIGQAGVDLPETEPVAMETICINGMPFVVNDIAYLRANQNYVAIHYFQKGKNEKQIMRATIKQLEMQLASFPEFIRCHKSYVVNTKRIVKCKGNSGKMEIQLENCPDKIPVSRKYVSCIRGIIKK